MKQNRPGTTVITSVSLSREFSDILKDYNISATDAMRKGIAVCMCEKGVLKYSSPMNKERLTYANKFIENLNEDETKVDLVKDLKINAAALLKLLSLIKE